jgi:hypothetical protein
MSVNLPGMLTTNGAVDVNPEYPALTLLLQRGLATRENLNKLKEIEIMDDRWRPDCSFDWRWKVGEAIERLNAAGLLNEENLTRLFGLGCEARQRLFGALSALEPDSRPQYDNLLDQRTLTAMVEHSEQDWGFFLAQLRSRDILNREVLNTLIDPANVEHASFIANGFVSLHEIRVNGAPLEEGPILEQYRTAVVLAGRQAAWLGAQLRRAHGFQGVPGYLIESCKQALLDDPENAEHIGNGFSALYSRGILEKYWQKIPEAKEHSETLVKAIVALHARSTFFWAIFYVNPQYALDAAEGVKALQNCPALMGCEGCVDALLSGETRGEHAAVIIERLRKIGFRQVTLEQFDRIVTNLPAPERSVMK